MIKSGLIFTFFLCLTTVGFAQTKKESLAKIRRQFQVINTEKHDSIVVLENEQWMEQMTDGGGELKGAFLKGDLRRVNVRVGTSYGIFLQEYYIWSNQLFFVYEKEQRFHYDTESGTFDYDSLTTPYEGRYYLRNGHVFDKKIKGESMSGNEKKEENRGAEFMADWLDYVRKLYGKE